MPSLPDEGCPRGCGNRTSGGVLCAGCKARRGPDRREGAHARGYDSRWDKIAARKLRRDPWCECDQCAGKWIPAGTEERRGTADHVIPLAVLSGAWRGDLESWLGVELYRDLRARPHQPSNLMSMTSACNTRKAKWEMRRLRELCEKVKGRR